MSWIDSGAVGATPDSYQVATGRIGELHADAGFGDPFLRRLCWPSSVPSVADARLTGMSGDGAWYLACPFNECGVADQGWGTDSRGAPRVLSCP